jgi:ABC-2 type transport system permease protein
MTLGASSVHYLVTMLLWSYALKGKPGADAHAMFVYLTLSFMLSYASSLFLERTIGERIREGLVATDLLKPVDFQLFYMVQSLSDLLYQGALAMVIFGLGLIFLGGDLLPPTPEAALGGVLSVALAFLVQYGICFIFVQGIFITNSNYGIFISRLALHQIFSGVFAPMTFFPPAFKAVAMLLPFHHVIFTPVSIYLGRIQGLEIIQALGSQLAWAIALLFLGRLLFRAIVSKIAIQGG